MQLGWRRRVLAAVATAAGAFALALVATGRGCAPLDASPEGAVRAFVSAARSGDRRAVWELLGPDSRHQLEVAAQSATDNVGGTRRFGPLDVLDVGQSEATWTPAGYAVVERRGDEAVVEVRGPSGQRDRVRAVKVRGRWRVELGWPAEPDGGAATQNEMTAPTPAPSR